MVVDSGYVTVYFELGELRAASDEVLFDARPNGFT